MFLFSTTVRSSEQKNIAPNIKPTGTWLLRPIISGEYWTGPECFTVEPGQPNYYELTYHPLTMTWDMQKHQASLKCLEFETTFELLLKTVLLKLSECFELSF